MNYIYYNGSSSNASYADKLDLVWHAGLAFSHFQWYLTHVDVISRACIQFSGRRAAISQNFIQWVNLECSWPWWHVFEPAPLEQPPLTNELNYSDWLIESKRLAALYKRLRRGGATAWWLISFEQPPATVTCLIYIYLAVNWFGDHLVTSLIFVPLLLLFLLNAPGTETFLRQKLIPNFPLILIILDNSKYRIPAFVAHTTITLSDIPVQDYFWAHHSLVGAPRQTKFTKYPYIAAFLKTTTSLLLWTIYGGFPARFYNDPELCNTGPLLRLPQYFKPDESQGTLECRPTGTELFTSTKLIAEEIDLNRPSMTLARKSNKKFKPRVKARRFHLKLTSLPRWIWVRIAPYHNIEKISAWQKPVLESLQLGVLNYSIQEPPFPEENNLIDQPNGSHNRTEILPGAVTKSVKAGTPKIAGMSGLWKFTSSLLTTQPQTETAQEAKPNSKTTIRSVVRDVASVSRSIIQYRRGIEKTMNLLTWTHPLASLVSQ